MLNDECVPMSSKRQPVLMTLDPNSRIAFDQAVRFMAYNSRREGRKILGLAAFSYIRAGRNITPKARKNKKREVKRLTGSTGRGGWPKFGIVVLSQWKKPKVVKVTTRKASGHSIKTIADVKKHVRMAKVPHIMAAKNSWYGVYRSLGKKMREGQGHQMRDVSRGQEGGTDLDPEYTIFNDLVYLLKIAPNVDQEGRRRAARDITFKTENMILKSWNRV